MKFYAWIKLGASQKEIMESLISGFADHNDGIIMGNLSCSREELLLEQENLLKVYNQSFADKKISQIQYNELIHLLDNYEIREFTIGLSS